MKYVDKALEFLPCILCFGFGIVMAYLISPLPYAVPDIPGYLYLHWGMTLSFSLFWTLLSVMILLRTIRNYHAANLVERWFMAIGPASVVMMVILIIKSVLKS